jgi:3-dehydroquinate synthase
VAIGLAAAMHCAVQTNRMQPDEERLVLDLLQLLELPTRLPRPIGASQLMEAMSHDKKAARGKLRVVLPRGLGAADIAEGVSTETIADAWMHIGAAAEAPAGDEFERILNSSSTGITPEITPRDPVDE